MDDRVVPDANGRVEGTTYPRDRAPKDARPFGARPPRRRELLLGYALRDIAVVGVTLLRPRPDDVLVLRAPGGKLPVEVVREVNLALRRQGHKGVAIVLPMDVAVHIEPPKLKREDRGYRETATYGTDRAKETGQTDRGVHVGVPTQALTPHPESERGEDDPCA